MTFFKNSYAGMRTACSQSFFLSELDEIKKIYSTEGSHPFSHPKPSFSSTGCL